MPLLRKGVLLPVEGQDFSVPATVINDRQGFPKNMRLYKGEMRKREGSALYGATIVGDSTQIMGMGTLETNAGLKYLVRASKAKIEKYDTATGDWVSIANVALTGGDDDLVNTANCTEWGYILITNWIDSIRKWTGAGGVSAFGAGEPFAKYIAYISPYPVLAYINDGVNVSPWKVQWPDTADPTDWTTGNSGALLCSVEPSPIKNIAVMNDFGVVYKRNSLYLLRPNEYDIFTADPVKTGIGLAASRAFADIGGIHEFMGLNDFYQWNGSQPQSIGASIRDEVFRKLNTEKINRCFAVHVRQYKEVWFFIVTSGNEWPTEIWKHNYENNFWYYDTCDQITAMAIWQRTTAGTWDADVGTWDEAIDRWDDSTQNAESDTLVFGDKYGYCRSFDPALANDSGTAVEGWFESKDFTGETFERYSRWEQFDVWASGTYGARLYVDYSTDYGLNWTNIPYTSSTAYATLTESCEKYEFWFDKVAEHVRFRIRNAQSGEIFTLRQFMPYYLSREEKRS